MNEDKSDLVAPLSTGVRLLLNSPFVSSNGTLRLRYALSDKVGDDEIVPWSGETTKLVFLCGKNKFKEIKENEEVLKSKFSKLKVELEIG